MERVPVPKISVIPWDHHLALVKQTNQKHALPLSQKWKGATPGPAPVALIQRPEPRQPTQPSYATVSHKDYISKRDIFPFLELPGELRNEIYALVIITSVYNCFFIDYQCAPNHDCRRDGFRICPGAVKLIGLNRKLSEEARTMLYGHNFTFSCPSTYQTFAEMIGPDNLALIKDIAILKIGLEEGEGPDWDDPDVDYCSKCYTDISKAWDDSRDFSAAARLLPDIAALDSLTIWNLDIPSYSQLMQLPDCIRDRLLTVAVSINIHEVASVAEAQHIFSMISKATRMCDLAFIDPKIPELQWRGFQVVRDDEFGAYSRTTAVQRGQIMFKVAHAWFRHLVHQHGSHSILDGLFWICKDSYYVHRGIQFYYHADYAAYADNSDRPDFQEIIRLLELGDKYDPADESTWS
ncbi:hypothetical protein FKW77_008434 [Venturia effusa]|uniref:Uncharacterized protein n=1 Tax=Venturia effusa TaxID=50376 RepID=A0A517LKP0_9PEZI|nr:hypothetical protein FKW77_008434 [Venturia effusa]